MVLVYAIMGQGEGTRIEDPSRQDRAGRGLSLNPISSQSLTVFFIYLVRVCCERQTPAPLVAAAVAAAPTLAALPCRVVTRGEGTRIEDPSHQDRAGRGHMSLNPISSQSLPVLFIDALPAPVPLCP